MPPKDRIPLTGLILGTKGVEIAKDMLQRHEQKPYLSDAEVKAMKEFKGSQQWGRKVAKACGYTSVALHGEAGSVDLNAIKTELEALKNKIATYAPSNVYNMDETGYNFQVLPNRSYVRKGMAKVARGTKGMSEKKRVTLYVCTNEDGTDKVPLAMIGTSKEPRCFKAHKERCNRDPPLKYFNQKKAWSDTKTVKKWWEFFLEHIRARTREKVLLIMDNCGPHGTEMIDPTNQVEVAFLPPNCTSLFQPMDAGIIAVLKRTARRTYLMKLFSILESRNDRREASKNFTAGTRGIDEGCAPHIIDAMYIIKESWDSAVTTSVVQNCWRKCTLRRDDAPNPIDQSQPEGPPIADRHMLELLHQLKNTPLDSPMTGTGKILDPFGGLLEEFQGSLASMEDDEIPDMLDVWAEIEEEPAYKEMVQEEMLAEIPIPRMIDSYMGVQGANGAESCDSSDEEVEAPTERKLSKADIDTLKELAKKMKSDSWLHPVAQRAMDLVFSVEVIVKKEERKEQIKRKQNSREPKITTWYSVKNK